MGEVGGECTKPCSRIHMLRDSVDCNKLRDEGGLGRTTGENNAPMYKRTAT